MIYTTGTIAGNGNTLTGTGTNFAAAGTLIRNGCTVIVLSAPAQVFQITAVNSATQLAVTPAVNPAIPAGTRYAILLSDSKSLDGFALDLAETFGMYQAYMSGFADVMTGTGNVTITINGVSVTVPTQKSLVQKGPNGTVPVTLGGTGGNTQATGRAGLGLGNSATRNVHEAAYANGAAVAGVALQIHSDYRAIAGYDITENFPLGVSGGIQDAAKYGAAGGFIGLLSMRGWGDSSGSVACWQLAVNNSLQAFRIPIQSSDGYWYLQTFKIWNQRNTTVDGNGFIKQASPIARLTNDPSVMPPTFLDGFTIAGATAVNDEAAGVEAVRVSTGVYEVRGATGLHNDGWTIEIPQDTNGNRLCFVEIDTADDGTITVSVFKRRFDIDTAMIVAGDPMDIPAGRWIDLRLEMPADSIYNQQMKAADEVVIKDQAALVENDAESMDQSSNAENQ